MVLYDASGQMVQTGAEVGQGGEGTVFAVNGKPGLLAKVYLKAPTAEKAEKLSRMVGVRTDALSRVAAWPTSVLRSSPDGPVKGLLMPRATDSSEAHLLYGPKSRRDEFKNADYAFLVHAAINVAGAFSVVHGHGHVIGDVNHSGVMVSQQGTVTLIDCDSFQVKTNAGVFRCEVGVPEYTPPELQGKRLDQTERSADHDAFGLAVMIFHLLFMGRHPYAGTPTDGASVPIDKAILQYRFAYASWAGRARIAQPPNTLPLGNASPVVATLFERAFGPLAPGAKRPTATEWVSALTTLRSALVKCPRVPTHMYWAGAGGCPWCHFEKAIGFDYFPVLMRAATAGAAHAFDIDGVWREIESILAPIPFQAPALIAQPSTQPSPRAVRARTVRASARVGAVLTAAVIILVGLVVGIGTESFLWGIFFGWIGLAAGARLWQWKPAGYKDAASSSAAARREYEAVRKSADWSSNPFANKVNSLRADRQRLAGLPQERKLALAELNNQRRARQLERYLSRQRIAKAKISLIGSGLTQMLASWSIETAADVSRAAVSRVPGFGEQRVNRMLEWRKTVERHFVFDPNQGVDPGDVAAINNRLDAAARSLETELRGGKLALVALRDKMNRDVVAATRSMDGILLKYDQALCDAEYLGVEE